MGIFDDKVVLITGAARGQGRSHAVHFAQEGASIIAVDLCADADGVKYPLGTTADLEETAELVRAAGGKVVTAVADTRDQSQIDAAVAAGVEAFGRLDVVCANAGIFTGGAATWELSDEAWLAAIDINLTGTWRTCKAAVPAMIAAGNGGSIVITASANGYRAEEYHTGYNVSKIGLVSLMRSLASELGQHGIRVNTVHPTTVRTPMMWNDAMVGDFFGKTTAEVDPEEFWNVMAPMHMLPIGSLEASEVSDVILFLASEKGRHITASEIPIDGGYIKKNLAG